MAEGQFLGRRAVYLYTSDSGQVFTVRTDETLGSIDGCGLVRATSANVGNASPKPSGFKFRCVYWQGVLNDRIVRKKIICNSNGTLYVSGVSQGLRIDGVDGSTTGKRGEQVSFQRIDALAVAA